MNDGCGDFAVKDLLEFSLQCVNSFLEVGCLT